ncbi:MAG TPA: DUF4258 domain-containing protein [Terriglobia bacterium]|nr:DUF4258 domain-containing protein [Terriglobia bacterium]
MKGVPKITKWVLSPHAVSRMEERHISLAKISLLIADPDLRIAQGPKWIFAKALPDRSDNLVAAVLLERQEKSLWVVVTVMARFEGQK